MIGIRRSLSTVATSTVPSAQTAASTKEGGRSSQRRDQARCLSVNLAPVVPTLERVQQMSK